MAESVNLDHLIPFEPNHIPGLVAFWEFDETGTNFKAKQGEPYTLISQSGVLDVVEDKRTP